MTHVRYSTRLDHTGGTLIRAALYARVSTRKKGQDLELQLEDLRRKADQQGWVPTEYSDEGWSGSRVKRPGLDALMADVHAGKIDVVCVWRFDRFARSLQHLVSALSEFQALGVEFVSMYEQIDTRTAMGRAMFQIIGAMAELERELIRERVQAGVHRAREKGKRLGRPPTKLFDLNTISHLLHAGTSMRGIALATGVPLTTIRRTVRALTAAEGAPNPPCSTPPE